MGGDELRIDPAEPHGLNPVCPQRRQEVDVDLPGVNQLGHLEGAIVRNPAPSHHPGLEAEPATQGRGLRAATVDHHDPDAERRKQGELSRHAVENLGRSQDVSTQLYHEDLVTVGADVAERTFESGDALRRVDGQCCLLSEK